MGRSLLYVFRDIDIYTVVEQQLRGFATSLRLCRMRRSEVVNVLHHGIDGLKKSFCNLSPQFFTIGVLVFVVIVLRDGQIYYAGVISVS